MAEQKNLTPNVMTFGVLALGCQKYHEAKEFLDGLEAFGYRPNAVIMGTLINTACHNRDFEYLLFVMNYMVENKIRPNEQAIKDLKEFSRKILRMEVPTVHRDFFTTVIKIKLFFVFIIKNSNIKFSIHMLNTYKNLLCRVDTNSRRKNVCKKTSRNLKKTILNGKR